MTDRTYCNLMIFGPVHDTVLTATAEMLAAKFCRPADEIADSLRQYHGQNYAIFEESECYSVDFDGTLAGLRTWGIPHRLDWAGGGGYDAGATIWVPGMPEPVHFPVSDGAIVVTIEGNLNFEADVETANDALSRLFDYGTFTVLPAPAEDFAEVEPSHWTDDPEFPPADWRLEVEAEDTRLGYREWVEAKRVQAEEAL